MHHAQLTEHVRQLIRDYYSKLGEAYAESPHETILIRQGYYCGRRFIVHDQEAVWFMEEKQLKFYDSNGGVLQTVSVRLDQPKRQRTAA